MAGCLVSSEAPAAEMPAAETPAPRSTPTIRDVELPEGWVRVEAGTFMTRMVMHLPEPGSTAMLVVGLLSLPVLYRLRKR